MTIEKTHSLETVGGVSLAAGGAAADGADMWRTQESVGGLSLDLLDALTLLAQDRGRGGGLRLVGEDGLGGRAEKASGGFPSGAWVRGTADPLFWMSRDELIDPNASYVYFLPTSRSINRTVFDIST